MPSVRVHVQSAVYAEGLLCWDLVIWIGDGKLSGKDKMCCQAGVLVRRVICITIKVSTDTKALRTTEDFLSGLRSITPREDVFESP